MNRLNLGLVSGVGSLALHALLAAGVWFVVEYGDATELASLDLSAVDLSFAEEEVAEAEPFVAPLPEPPRPPLEPELPPPPPLDEEILAEPPTPEAIPLTEITPDPPPKMEKEDAEKAPEKAEASPPPPPESAPSVNEAPVQGRIDSPARLKNKRIRPQYPRKARERGEEGAMLLELTISPRGTVSAVRIVESTGYADLDEAGVTAAKTAHFNPAKRDGRPVESRVRLPISFRLTR